MKAVLYTIFLNNLFTKPFSWLIMFSDKIVRFKLNLLQKKAIKAPTIKLPLIITSSFVDFDKVSSETCMYL